MANAIKKKDETNVVAFDPSMFEKDANQGLGNLGMDDLAIPFLRILSDTSPQIKKRDPQYIEGAESGMIYNTLTKEIYDGEAGAKVIPCAYQRQYIEWIDINRSTTALASICPFNILTLICTRNDLCPCFSVVYFFCKRIVDHSTLRSLNVLRIPFLYLW